MNLEIFKYLQEETLAQSSRQKHKNFGKYLSSQQKQKLTIGAREQKLVLSLAPRVVIVEP
jgi:hypothetical protein